MVVAESAAIAGAVGSLKWLLRALAQADDGSDAWVDARKVLGGTILAGVQDAVLPRISGAAS